MMENRLGAVRDPEAPFPLDRVIATVLQVAIVVGFLLTVRNTVDWWHYYQREDAALTYLGLLQRGWWVHTRYITSTALSLWLTFGLAKGSRWAFVSFALLGIGSLANAIHSGSAFNLGLFSFEIVYATMRLMGSLGASPSRRADPGDVPLRLDRYAASLDLLLSVIAIGLYVNSTLRGWHAVQDMGTVDYLPYLSKSWWSRVGYVGETILEFWATTSYFRSQRWAFAVLAFMSLGWLFHPIHTGDAFYIASNAYTLAYCAGRLAWVQSRPRILEREI